MPMRQLILTIFTVLMLSLGQVLFKYASGKIDIPGKGYVASFLLNPTLIAALVVYGSATILWLFVLKSAPLRIAYPFAALAFFIVPLFAYALLGEALRWPTFAGAIVIVLGVYISLM